MIKLGNTKLPRDVMQRLLQYVFELIWLWISILSSVHLFIYACDRWFFSSPPMLFLFLRDWNKSLISSYIILFYQLLFILSCYLFHHYFNIYFTIFFIIYFMINYHHTCFIIQFSNIYFITYLISVYFVWKVSRNKNEIPKKRTFMYRWCILLSNVREKPNELNMNIFCEHDKSIYF